MLPIGTIQSFDPMCWWWLQHSWRPLVLVCLPNTTSQILHRSKDVLDCYKLPLELCTGQALEAAAKMHIKRAKECLATLIRRDVPAAQSVPCFAHCLYLCLQDAGRKKILLRAALDVVREVDKLIKYSPKGSHLFSEKLAEENSSGVTLSLFLLHNEQHVKEQ